MTSHGRALGERWRHALRTDVRTDGRTGSWLKFHDDVPSRRPTIVVSVEKKDENDRRRETRTKPGGVGDVKTWPVAVKWMDSVVVF